jgi:hypothetical protein
MSGGRPFTRASRKSSQRRSAGPRGRFAAMLDEADKAERVGNDRQTSPIGEASVLVNHMYAHKNWL